MRQSVKAPFDAGVDHEEDAEVERIGATTPPRARTLSVPDKSPSQHSLTASPAPSSAATTTDMGGAHSFPASATKRAGRAKSTKSGIFSNFRQWFVVDAQKKQQRKRNTINLAPAYRSPAAAAARGSGVGLSSASLAHAQQGYRPSSSRRSSTSSVPAPSLGHANSLSRRSSVNSAHVRRRTSRTSPTVGPRRRQSDSSVPSMSDREPSRPPSVDLSGIATTSKPLRTHRKTGSFSSASATTSSGRPASSGANASPRDTFRRPPTVTTVRRMHGPQSQQHHHHRRGHSGSSSVRTARSSSSSAGEEESDPQSHRRHHHHHHHHHHMGKRDHAVLLEDVDEEDVESVRQVERSKALSKLSGEWTDLVQSPPLLSHDQDEPTLATSSTKPVAPSLERFHSRESEYSTSSSRPHSPIIFSAHRTTHVFGHPTQPSHQRQQHHHQHQQHAAPLRDVFASKRSRSSASRNADDEWVDDDEDEDDDELGAFSGGLGQTPLSRSTNSRNAKGKNDSNNDRNDQVQQGSPNPIAHESWRSHLPRSSTFRKAVTITEEEEDEGE